MSCEYCCSFIVCIVVVVLCVLLYLSCVYCCSSLVCIVVVVLCVLLLIVLCVIPVSEGPQTGALDCETTGMDINSLIMYMYYQE